MANARPIELLPLLGRQGHLTDRLQCAGEKTSLGIIAVLVTGSASGVGETGKQAFLEASRPAYGVTAFEQCVDRIRPQFLCAMYYAVFPGYEDAKITKVIGNSQPRAKLLDNFDSARFVAVVLWPFGGRCRAFTQIVH